MAKTVKHAVTGEVAPLEQHDGRLHVRSAAGLKLFRTEDGEWDYHTIDAPLDPVQRAQMLHAADVQMRLILGERVRDMLWIDLRPNDMAQWIEGTVRLPGVRQRLHDHVLEFLEKLELEVV